MPPADYVHAHLVAAWRLMTGKADGLRTMDISADGFWRSFFAIVVALPARFANWVAIALDMAGAGQQASGTFSLVVKLALIDLGAWILPLVALALVAPLAGVRDRYAHYVIASNWGSVIIAWIMVPPTVVGLFFPDAREGVTLVSVCLFMATLVLMWRLTNAAIGKGPSIATGVFVAMLLASLFVLFGMQDLLGLGPIA